MLSTFTQNVIQERCMQDPEIISSSSPRLTGAPPDTLYMLGNQTMPTQNSEIEKGIDYDSSKLPGMISKCKKTIDIVEVISQNTFTLTPYDSFTLY